MVNKSSLIRWSFIAFLWALILYMFFLIYLAEEVEEGCHYEIVVPLKLTEKCDERQGNEQSSDTDARGA